MSFVFLFSQIMWEIKYNCKEWNTVPQYSIIERKREGAQPAHWCNVSVSNESGFLAYLLFILSLWSTTVDNLECDSRPSKIEKKVRKVSYWCSFQQYRNTPKVRFRRFVSNPAEQSVQHITSLIALIFLPAPGLFWPCKLYWLLLMVNVPFFLLRHQALSFSLTHNFSCPFFPPHFFFYYF